MAADTGVPALDTVLVWGGAVSLFAGLVTVVWRLVRGVARFGRRVNEFMDDWRGEPSRPGVKERSGVMARMAGLEGRMGELEEGFARVMHELYPNSGESLRDAVDLANHRLALLCPDECPPGDGRPAGGQRRRHRAAARGHSGGHARGDQRRHHGGQRGTVAARMSPPH
ncbi:hypothetical protein ACWD1Y_42205 [Streptomyces sp. NPDC002814]